MKLRILLSLTTIFYLLVSCGDGEFYPDEIAVEEEIELPEEMQSEEQERKTFPCKYVYKGVDFNPSEFFLIDGNMIEQIFPDREPFTVVDEILLEEYFGEEGIYFPFREIILLSDSIARMKIVSQDSEEELNPEFSYKVNENKYQLFFSPDPLDFVTLTFDEENNRFVSCLQSHTFIHEKREFEALRIDDCTSENRDEVIEELINREINNESLQEKDTLILNISNLVLELEE